MAHAVMQRARQPLKFADRTAAANARPSLLRNHAKPQVGTGCMDLLLDKERLKEAVSTAELDTVMLRGAGAAAGGGAGSQAGAVTPHFTPYASPGLSPSQGAMGTPFGNASFSPAMSPFASPGSAGASFSPNSPRMGNFSPDSPGGSGGFSPSSPAYRCV
jgi:hypothetical protein